MKTYVIKEKYTNVRFELNEYDIKKCEENKNGFFITTNNNEKLTCDYIMCFIE